MAEILPDQKVADYLNALKEAIEEINDVNSKYEVSLGYPRLSSKITESFAANKLEEILQNVQNVQRLVEDKDLNANISGEVKSIEVKATKSDERYQNIEKDIGCDYLLWLDFRNFLFRDSDNIEAYILTNQEEKIENYVSSRQDLSNSGDIRLEKFKEMNPDKTLLNL